MRVKISYYPEPRLHLPRPEAAPSWPRRRRL